MARPDLPGGQYLTESEAETLGYVLRGHTRQEIAEMRGCTARTISWHTDAAYRNLGIRGAINAWRRLEELGLLERVLEAAGARSRGQSPSTAV